MVMCWGQAEKVFVYGLREKYEVYFDFFFQIHGRIVQRHRVNEVLEPDQGEQLIEDVDALQSEVMDAGIGLLLELT